MKNQLIFLLFLALFFVACKKKDEPKPSSMIISLSGDLSFGEVEIGKTASKILKISNSGTAILKVSSLVLPAGFEANFSGDIAVNGSQEITLVFKPTEEKDYSGQITVNADHTSGTNTISVLGKGKKIAVVVPTTPLAFLLKNTGQAYGKGLAVDKNDNFYYTSLFQGSIEGKSITSVGGIDNYFAKHDKNGNLIWERSFGGASTTTVAHGIDTDDAGNVCLAGYFGVDGQNASRTINFGNGKAAVSKSGFDAFVAKYDASGTVQWGFSLGNSAGNTEERAWDIVADANGNIYVSGAMSGTVNFNPLGTTRTLTTMGIGHFLAKYNSAGENLWAIKFDANITSLFTEGYTTVDFDQNGNVFLAGVYRNSLTIGSTTLTSAGNTDFFLASFNATNGNANWAKSFGGLGNDIISPGAMRVNKNGEPHLTGRFSGTSNFGGTNLSSNSAGNVFVLACNPSGSTKWAIVLQSSQGLDGGHRVDFDAQNNVYVAGWFRGTTNFNGRGTANITANGTSDAGDVFLAKYNTNGDYLWAKNIGGVVSGADNLAICAGLGVDSQGNSIITGKVYGTNIDFDTHASETFNLSSSGQDDCFVAKYTTNGEVFKK